MKKVQVILILLSVFIGSSTAFETNQISSDKCNNFSMISSDKEIEKDKSNCPFASKNEKLSECPYSSKEKMNQSQKGSGKCPYTNKEKAKSTIESENKVFKIIELDKS